MHLKCSSKKKKGSLNEQLK